MTVLSGENRGASHLGLAAAHCYFQDYEAAAHVAADAYEHGVMLESNQEAIAALKLWLDAILAGELDEAISTSTRQMIESRIGPGGCCRSRKR